MRRDRLLREASQVSAGPLAVELDGLERDLRQALTAPNDHLRQCISEYEAARAAAEAAASHRRHRRRSLWAAAMGLMAIPSAVLLLTTANRAHRVRLGCGIAWGAPHLSMTLFDQGAVEFQCVAEHDADCREVCSHHGACAVVEGGCRPRKPEHCAQSTYCAGYGMCGLGARGCEPRADSDCRQSAQCREFGLCFLREGHCWRASAASCRASQVCARSGMCELGPSGDCVALTDASCAASEDCTLHGACEVGPNGTCVMGCESELRWVQSGFGGAEEAMDCGGS